MAVKHIWVVGQDGDFLSARCLDCGLTYIVEIPAPGCDGAVSRAIQAAPKPLQPASIDEWVLQ